MALQRRYTHVASAYTSMHTNGTWLPLTWRMPEEILLCISTAHRVQQRQSRDHDLALQGNDDGFAG